MDVDRLAPTLLSSTRSVPTASFTPAPMPEHPFARHARSASAGATPSSTLRTAPLTIASSGLKPHHLSTIDSVAGDSPTDPTYRLPISRQYQALPTPPESASTYPSTDEAQSGHVSPLTAARSVSDRSDPFALGNLVPPSTPGVVAPTAPVSPSKAAARADAFSAIVLRPYRSPSASRDRLVTLNVGGRTFTTALGTVLAQPSNLEAFVRSAIAPSESKPDVPELALPADVTDEVESTVR